jgi:hypothetical protein
MKIHLIQSLLKFLENLEKNRLRYRYKKIFSDKVKVESSATAAKGVSMRFSGRKFRSEKTSRKRVRSIAMSKKQSNFVKTMTYLSMAHAYHAWLYLVVQHARHSWPCPYFPLIYPLGTLHASA